MLILQHHDRHMMKRGTLVDEYCSQTFSLRYVGQKASCLSLVTPSFTHVQVCQAWPQAFSVQARMFIMQERKPIAAAHLQISCAMPDVYFGLQHLWDAGQIKRPGLCYQQQVLYQGCGCALLGALRDDL